jgi:hypothetical protein
LFSEPNNRFQGGGTGYLRIPLDAPRKTRADAPPWFECRASYFRTLRTRRAVRAEQILSEFYACAKTDAQIAGTLGWKKDSVKKEREELIRRGNRYFQNLTRVEHPPKPAINEEAEESRRI